MTEDQPGLEPLLEFLRDERGFDFTGYKRASLGRRIRKRMQDVDVADFEGYLGYLQANPKEVASLFDTILINVTAFRRDEEHWDYIRDKIIPDILARDHGDDGIRVWSAGCSSGEEAYTLAMLFCEAMGVETFREKVKIYATDVDDNALEQARHGVYDERQLTDLDDALVERYFERDGARFEFRRDVRRSVIFGRHDLVQDAPISRVDLLVCRNLLMYFTGETQARILSRLHFALDDEGYLFLGRAEMLSTRTHLFTSHDLRHRVFEKSPDSLDPRPTPRPPSLISMAPMPTRAIRLRDLAFQLGTTAQLVVDHDGTLVMANRRARAMFDVRTDAVGRQFADSEMSYRPIELRGHMEEAQREQRTVRLSNVARVDSSGRVEHLDIALTPLEDRDQDPIGILLTFFDVSDFERLRADLQRSNHDLETAYEELQSTNEELETTNEELQSTVEELETNNEELHSANEELETMNEELQSSNLEQEEVNTELNRRSFELNQANAFLEVVLSTLEHGVIVVGEQLHVRIWDLQSEDTWGLRADEVLGEPLAGLDIGLPVEDLLPVIEACINEQSVTNISVDAVNRRGRPVSCTIRCQPLAGNAVDRGALLVLDVHEREDES